jgi:hypothetical protein
MKKSSILRAATALAVLSFILPSPAASAKAETPVEIGWAEVDITPPPVKRIPLCGQYYQRLADKDNPYHSRLKFVALALKQGDEYVLMGSIDNVTTWTPFVERVRARVKELVPDISPERIYMGSIHTHSAPAIRPSGTPKAAEMERDQPDVLGPNEYADFALDLVAGAYVQAWKNRRPGGLLRAALRVVRRRERENRDDGVFLSCHRGSPA